VKYTDQDILKAIRNGNDHKALEALYKTMMPKVKKLVTTSLDKEEEAKDVLQEALLIFYKQVVLNKFDEKYQVQGFIYSISRNLWINRAKRKQRMVTVDNNAMPEVIEYSSSDDMEVKERKELVQKIFAQLDEKCQQLLTYTIYEELSMKEVAEKMGYNNANAATVATYRCKKSLMDLVKNNKSIQNN
jgi:RNA polymerase sigma factor (sigma-70 family)